MTVRIGINGVGRIGRNLWRIIHTGAPDLRVAAVNDTADLVTLAHLLRHDSIRGRFPAIVDSAGGAIVVDGVPVPLSHAPTPAGIDWRRHRVDLVVEATGQFTRGVAARGHLSAGAPTVVVSTTSPGADLTVMVGINEHEYDPRRHRVISNSCCTTYCLAGIAAPLHQAFGVVSGAATIAYSHGSRPGPLLDGFHRHPRLARANATSIVPTGVPGVARAFDRVLPALAGRITATAMRVPVQAASAASFALRLARPADPAQIHATLAHAASTQLKGWLEVTDEPLVSSDVIGRPGSCVVDAGSISTVGDLARVVGWYDNEWGYAHRLVDLIRHLVCRPAGCCAAINPPPLHPPLNDRPRLDRPLIGRPRLDRPLSDGAG